MYKKLALSLACTSVLLSFNAHAADLWQIYQLAAKNDATYQAAVQTYHAAAEATPIAAGSLLPSVVLTGNTTWNDNLGSPSYNSNGYTLSLTQPLLNLGSWANYSQADINVKIAALSLAQSEQTLLTSVASDYFAVLQNQDNLRYAQAYLEAQKETMMQAEQKYKVGLAAVSDVQAARAQYESAIAQTVADENAVQNSLEALSVLTGEPEKDLIQLKPEFTLFKPVPTDINSWVQAGLKQNLALQQARLQPIADQWGIRIQQSGFLPTVNAVAQTSYSNVNNGAGTSYPKSIGLSASYTLFSGGSTVAAVKQARYTKASDEASAENTRRQTTSNIRQAYLNVLSDISQVEAYKQAIISGEASLAAARAAYQVGTMTIVDLLNQESDLLNSQQNYAQAINNYVNDSLNLKLQAGNLTPNDLALINKSLLLQAAHSSTPATPAKKQG